MLLALLVTFTTLYLFLIGEFVYSERQPSSAAGALICDFFAGTCYVTVITRLLGVADSIKDSHQRTVAVLAYFVYTSTATFVATLRSGSKVTKNCQVRTAQSVASVSVVLTLHLLHLLQRLRSYRSGRSVSCRSG